MVDVRVYLRSSVGILDEALDLTADLCTALFLQEPLKLSNLFEDRQARPCFSKLQAFHALFVRHKIANSFPLISETRCGLIPIVSGGNSGDFGEAFLGPVWLRLFLCWFAVSQRKSGRKICVSSLLSGFSFFLHGCLVLKPNIPKFCTLQYLPLLSTEP